MALPSTSYEPRRPAESVLHQIVQEHLETFLAQAARQREGDGLPQFVERAFREFLQCGFLAGGFARFHCGECGLDRLVAFSCKGRALCPSCGGRRMHALVLDGVFARDAAGVLAFRPARRLTTLDVAEVLAAVEPRIRRLLDGDGLPEGDHGGHAEDGGIDPWTDEAPALAGLAAAAVQGLVALGRHAGTRLHRLGHAGESVDPRPLGTCHARWNGLDLHAGLVVPAGQRDRLERVCRYARDRPSRPSGSPARPTARCGSRSGNRGPTGRRTWCSTRWSSWGGWLCWCRGRAST